MPRRRKPEEYLNLVGAYRADRHGNRCDVKAEPVRLEAPSYISDAARKHWDEIADLLAELNITTASDAPALMLLCDSLAQYIAARAEVAKHGTTTVNRHGCVVMHPAVRVMNTAREQVVRMVKEFGMTPATRGNVRAAKPAVKESGVARFFAPRAQD